MIPVVEICQDVARDNVNETENGYFGYEKFNRMSRRAELRMLDFLTGDIKDIAPPMMQSNQKSRDWLSPFVVPIRRQVSNGEVNLPLDYYLKENVYVVGNYAKDASCETELTEEEKDCNTPVEVLRSDVYTGRCTSYIESLRPSLEKPIARVIGKRMQFSPRDLGTIGIDYVRYPKFAKIATRIDPVYNDTVPDSFSSIDYEWDEYARELLVWFITDTFSIHSREMALRQHNTAAGKQERDNKQ